MNTKAEKITKIPIKDLHPFPNHPFSVKEDVDMQDLVESIKDNGVITPVVVSMSEDGGYEIVSGHRRVHACMLAGLTEIPAVVRNLSRDEAIIIMVDSNLQRDHILPCEKAEALKMKMEVLKKQGKRNDLIAETTSSQPETRLRADEQIAKELGESRATIQRYIRLTELIPVLKELVNKSKIGITTAVELSYLSKEEQKWVAVTIDSEQAVPSLSQAQKMKKLSSNKMLTEDTVLEIMIQQKKPEQQNITIKSSSVRKFFPKNYTDDQIETVILKLLEGWYKHRQAKQAQASQPEQKKERNKNEPSL